MKTSATLSPRARRTLIRALLTDWARTRNSASVIAQRRAFNLISEADATAQLETLQRQSFERASILARQLDARTVRQLSAMTDTSPTDAPRRVTA